MHCSSVRTFLSECSSEKWSVERRGKRERDLSQSSGPAKRTSGTLQRQSQQHLSRNFLIMQLRKSGPWKGGKSGKTIYHRAAGQPRERAACSKDNRQNSFHSPEERVGHSVAPAAPLPPNFIAISEATIGVSGNQTKYPASLAVNLRGPRFSNDKHKNSTPVFVK